MTRIICVLACLLVLSGTGLAQQVPIYTDQGGATMHVGDNGELTVDDGGVITIDTTIQTGKLSWLTSAQTCSYTHSLGSTSYSVFLEPTLGVTLANISSRAANSFTVTASVFPTSDVSQRFLLIPGGEY